MKKNYTICGIFGLILGIIGGVAGTAFSLGADKQRINDTLIRHTSEMATIEIENKAHEEATRQELERFAKIVSAQMTQIQGGISNLTETVGDLRTDVQVLKALMERMEQDFQNRPD